MITKFRIQTYFYDKCNWNKFRNIPNLLYFDDTKNYSKTNALLGNSIELRNIYNFWDFDDENFSNTNQLLRLLKYEILSIIEILTKRNILRIQTTLIDKRNLEIYKIFSTCLILIQEKFFGYELTFKIKKK